MAFKSEFDCAPKVAVLLAAYNGEKYIEEQLRSILCQNGCEVTVYISLDRSDDGSESLISRIASESRNVIFLRYGDAFGAASKNFFRLFLDVNFDDYDYVALSDQDDIWLPDKVIRGVSAIKNRKVSGYSSDMTAFWPDGKKVRLKKSYPQKKYDHFMESGGAGCTCLIPSSVAFDFSQFLIRHPRDVDKVDYHDWLLYAYVKEKYGSWYIDDKSLILYRQHSGNEIGMNAGSSATLKRVKRVQSKWYRSQVSLVSGLIQKDLGGGDFRPTTVFILKNFLQCRRRPRDLFMLFVLIVVGFY